MQLPRVDMVILDRIARPEHDRSLQAWNGPEQRRAGPRAAGTSRSRWDRPSDRPSPSGSEENLVPLALCEAHHLVLDRRTVARTGALDLTGIHRRAMKIGANDLVGRRSCLGNVTGDLRRRDLARQIREGHRRPYRRPAVPRHRNRWCVHPAAPACRSSSAPIEAGGLQSKRKRGRRRLDRISPQCRPQVHPAGPAPVPQES